VFTSEQCVEAYVENSRNLYEKADSWISLPVTGFELLHPCDMASQHVSKLLLTQASPRSPGAHSCRD
jgi:hypothetical protein